MLITSERKQHLIALMALGAVFCLMLAPVLFFGQAFGQSDTSGALYPILSFFQRSLLHGQSLLWSNNVFSGFPLFVLGNYFNPFYFLTVYVNVFSAYHWLTLGNILAAAFLTYYFLRRKDFDFFPALVGGLIYVGGMWGWIADMSLSAALPILPALLLLLTALHEKPSWWPVVTGGGVIGYGVYAANFNLLPLALVAAGLYVLFLSLHKTSAGTWQWQTRLPLAFAGMVTLGISLGLPQLLATYRFAALSARVGGLGFAAASEGALQPLDMVQLLAPYAKLPFLTSGNYAFLGAFGLLLLVAGIALRRSKENGGEKIVERKFFVFLLGISLAIAIKYSPFFWIISKLPLLGSLRAPGRWLWLAVFAASYLAAYGSELLHDLRADERLLRLIIRLWRWLVVVWAAITVFATVISLLFRQSLLHLAKDLFVKRFYNATMQLPLEHYYRVIEQMLNDFLDSFNLLHPSVLLPALFLVATALVLQSYIRGRITQKRLLSLCVVGAALNFLFILTPYHSTVSQALFARQSEIVTYLKEHPGKYFSFLPGSTEYQLLSVPHTADHADALEFQLAQLPPNYSLLYDLRGADYYNNLMSRRMARILASIGSDRATTGDKLTDEKIPVEQKVKKFEERKNILNLLGIHYIISAYPLDEKKFVKISESSATRFNIPIYLYANPEARPWVYLGDDARTIKESEERSFKQTLTSSLPRRSIVLECESCKTTEGQARGEVALKTQENGKWRISVTTPDDRWLVVSENNLPGWIATLDGKEAAIHFANSTFIAVFIPAGSHEVTLDFRFPMSF